ncbi:unnamed protein product [Linum trigynum]|uniref:Uncharacterized protein n=1 Tax=Linum trigynum TaxID=586398 RepID=A0AAV2DMP0_9ROSI
MMSAHLSFWGSVSPYVCMLPKLAALYYHVSSIDLHQIISLQSRDCSSHAASNNCMPPPTYTMGHIPQH